MNIGVTGAQSATFDHDNGKADQAWYLQYFAYDPRSAVPTGYQRAQYATAFVGTQPEDTLIDWSVPGSVYSPELDGTSGQPNISFVTLKADGEFTSSPVAVLYTYTFHDDDGQTYTATFPDDTTDTPINPSQSQDVKLVRNLSAHKPSDITDEVITEVSWTPPNGPPWPIPYPLPPAYCGRLYSYSIKDGTGSGMPGVWVQERPVGNAPPGMTWNTTFHWTTTFSGPGNFDQPDHLIYGWTGQPPFPTYQPVHEYWAATPSTTVGGIKLATYTITFQPGTPGTVTHSR